MNEEKHMRVTTITVRRLVNTGNYENTAWELTAELAEGDGLEIAGFWLQQRIAAMVRAERARRFPDVADRRWHDWLEEDEGEEIAAAPAGVVGEVGPS
jgi:hypothetical protein